MEQEKIPGKNQWYHETQSRRCQPEFSPSDTHAVEIKDRFLLGLGLSDRHCEVALPWLALGRDISAQLLPDSLRLTPPHSLSCYERLSTALTVAQVYGVQRLCSHYAIRLAPYSSPDSSRESNLRLTHLTQFARQLASQPAHLSPQSLSELAKCSLSAEDMMTFVHIVGFIGFQARAISLLQALQQFPVRYIPGFSSLQPANMAQFIEDCRYDWQPCLPAAQPSNLEEKTPGPPVDNVLSTLLNAQRSWLQHDSTSLNQLDKLSQTLSALTDHQAYDRQLTGLLTAQIHGCAASFKHLQEAWQGDNNLTDVFANAQGLQDWQNQHPRQQALMEACRLLTCFPQRFDDGQWVTLVQNGFTEADAFNLLLLSSLCGWINRVYLGLGHTLNRPKSLPF